MFFNGTLGASFFTMLLSPVQFHVGMEQDNLVYVAQLYHICSLRICVWPWRSKRFCLVYDSVILGSSFPARIIIRDHAARVCAYLSTQRVPIWYSNELIYHKDFTLSFIWNTSRAWLDTFFPPPLMYTVIYCREGGQCGSIPVA